MIEEVMTDEESNEIDALIDEVASQIEIKPVIVKEEVALTTVKADPKTDDDLIELTLQKNEDLETLANKAFNLFYGDLSRGVDHASSSKEQMLEALKVRVELNKTLVELAKLKKKQESKVGVLINTMTPNQAGINIRNIQSEFENGTTFNDL